MEIPEINIRSSQINIRDISVQEIRDWATIIPQAVPPTPPVVNELGIPIVDMPGCVESHETNNPSNSVVIEDDPKGSLTYCDAGVPSFNPINYTPEELNYTDPANIKNPSSPDESDTNTDMETGTPPPPPPPPTDCPNQKQKTEQPIGTIFDNGREIIVGYKFENGICIRVTEDIPIPAQIVNAIPPAGIITTTASIALVATTSALIAKPFADILLKVVKPTIKKVVKKIAAIRGKQPKVQSKGERIAEQRDRNEAIKSIRKVIKK